MKVLVFIISILFLFNSMLHAQIVPNHEEINVRKEKIQKEPMDTINNMLRMDDTIRNKQSADPQVIVMNKKKRRNRKSNRCGK